MTQDTSGSTHTLEHLSLGKAVEYASEYDPGLLQPVPRSLSREQINVPSTLPFTGVDIWNGYELSWLESTGKPRVGILQCRVPVSSPNLIESKSFKLYLNSFNQTRIDSLDELKALISKDLSACAGTSVEVDVALPSEFADQQIRNLPGTNIDDAPISEAGSELSPQALSVNDNRVEETLCSDLLKSNCLITNQPDWASVMIKYVGPEIDKEGLLRYLVSFRQHNEFHEQCVERIFMDIQAYCKPEKLTVYACYTRRGGLDINPFRSNFESAPVFTRHARQ